MKISSIKKLGKQPVYDISVRDAEHYVLENGVVTHNTGVYLSADTILFISRAQEKEGTEVVGYNFNLRVEKSRYVKEKSVIPINVTWDGGLNPFTALFNIGLNSGIISETKKGYYSFIDGDTAEILIETITKKKFGKEEYIKMLTMKKFQEFVISEYQIPTTDIQQELQDELEDIMNG